MHATGQLLKGRMTVAVELPPELKPLAWQAPFALGVLCGVVLLLALQSVFAPSSEPRR